MTCALCLPSPPTLPTHHLVPTRQRKTDKEAQAAVIELYVRKIYKMHKIKSVDAFTSLAGNGKPACV